MDWPTLTAVVDLYVFDLHLSSFFTHSAFTQSGWQWAFIIGALLFTFSPPRSLIFSIYRGCNGCLPRRCHLLSPTRLPRFCSLFPSISHSRGRCAPRLTLTSERSETVGRDIFMEGIQGGSGGSVDLGIRIYDVSPKLTDGSCKSGGVGWFADYHGIGCLS